ncbi:YqaJ viral recombinase family protein [Brevundimonas sp. BAL450]|uniref:lambda exonuclease family protein n=1 Tax=Brevundimonas sp. BAL450 TaxID=1708162 RepID=UPI0018C9CAD4|nr:lambda exonuclease family protein [Brevundimonas sp. BAL450]MBG7616511.1 YqaJ viral recombinase family protein [Brevundimonas sp. BAL450]
MATATTTAPVKTKGHVTHHADVVQGSDEWHEVRRGLLTASEMKLIVTPTLKAASNEKERSHLYELLAQRISGHVEPHYVSDDMLRGKDDELEARELYSRTYAPVTEVGFITNDRWGFTLGYSPDGLVGDDGLIECKSRRQKFQIQTIADREMPADFTIQVQTGLLVSERKWIDFVSYCGGLPMVTIRVFPDPVIQAAILDAATDFEKRLQERMRAYQDALAAVGARLIPTERRIEQEMFI